MSGISVQKQYATVAVTISRDPARSKYQGLLAHRSAIDAEFGEDLTWDEKAGTKRSFIACTPYPTPETFQATHQWMLGRMERFRTVFGHRLTALSASASEPESD
jgi:hypothetical protein